MTWILTILGESKVPGTACMVVEISDNVHDHSAAADTVEQLVCEEFHDTYPAACICDIGWHHEEDRLIGVMAEGLMPDGSVSAVGITLRYRDKEFIGPLVEEQVREALERSHPGVVHTGTYWGQPYTMPEPEDDE